MTGSLVKPTGKWRYWIAAFCCMAYFVAFLDRSNIGVLLADADFTQTMGIASD